MSSAILWREEDCRGITMLGELKRAAINALNIYFRSSRNGS